MHDFLDDDFMQNATDQSVRVEMRNWPEFFKTYRSSVYFAENSVNSLVGDPIEPLLLLSFSGGGYYTVREEGTEEIPAKHLLILMSIGQDLGINHNAVNVAITVLRGRKQFLLFDSADSDKLCILSQSGTNLEYRFGEDPFEPNFTNTAEVKFCEPQKSKPMIADVRAGDTIYIPGMGTILKLST